MISFLAINRVLLMSLFYLLLLSCPSRGQRFNETIQDEPDRQQSSSSGGFINRIRDNIYDLRDKFVDRFFTKGILAPTETDPDQFRDIPQLVKSRNFKLQRHYIVTKDDYILGVHRIINPHFNKTKSRPVILQHGIISSGRDFIVNSPGGNAEEIFTNKTVGNNLGFELAKRGFDVWLTNSRGNTYSLNHRKLSSLQPKFWDYSFDELIKYDLPATIDYILNVTNSGELREMISMKLN